MVGAAKGKDGDDEIQEVMCGLLSATHKRVVLQQAGGSAMVPKPHSEERVFYNITFTTDVGPPYEAPDGWNIGSARTMPSWDGKTGLTNVFCFQIEMHKCGVCGKDHKVRDGTRSCMKGSK